MMFLENFAGETPPAAKGRSLMESREKKSGMLFPAPFFCRKILG